MVSSISGPLKSSMGNTGVAAYQKDSDGDGGSKEVIKDRDDGVKTSAEEARVTLSGKAQPLSAPANAPGNIASGSAVNRPPGVYQSYKGQNIDIKA